MSAPHTQETEGCRQHNGRMGLSRNSPELESSGLTSQLPCATASPPPLLRQVVSVLSLPWPPWGTRRSGAEGWSP